MAHIVVALALTKWMPSGQRELENRARKSALKQTNITRSDNKWQELFHVTQRSCFSRRLRVVNSNANVSRGWYAVLYQGFLRMLVLRCGFVCGSEPIGMVLRLARRPSPCRPCPRLPLPLSMARLKTSDTRPS